MSFDVDEILRDAEPPARKGRLESWLDGQDKKVQALFWDVIRQGYIERGYPFTRVFASFLRAVDLPEDHFGRQHPKAYVDRKLRDDGG